MPEEIYHSVQYDSALTEGLSEGETDFEDEQMREFWVESEERMKIYGKFRFIIGEKPLKHIYISWLEKRLDINSSPNKTTGDKIVQGVNSFIIEQNLPAAMLCSRKLEDLYYRNGWRSAGKTARHTIMVYNCEKSQEEFLKQGITNLKFKEEKDN